MDITGKGFSTLTGTVINFQRRLKRVTVPIAPHFGGSIYFNVTFQSIKDLFGRVCIWLELFGDPPPIPAWHEEK